MNTRTWSLKEIDSAQGRVKGTAFRAFKAVRTQLQEGYDYFYYSLEQDGAKVEELKAQRRIYASSVNALLFGEKAQIIIVEKMQQLV